MDHFLWSELIDFVPGATHLTLSAEGRNALAYSSPLIQKPVGATFRFFHAKPNTPISYIQWKNYYREIEPLGRTNYSNNSNYSYYSNNSRYDADDGYYGHSDLMSLFFGQCEFCD